MEYVKAFETIVKEQLERAERMKTAPQSTDYKALDKIIVGIIDGDGIGPIITQSCKKIMEHLMADEIAAGKLELRDIEGLTIENRIEKMETVPADVLAAVKDCHVLLKGPTMTPGKGDNMPNLESANVKLRKELDLFANVRPVSIPEKNINWTFFRENTEGEYALGSQGVDINDDISMDFKVTTTIGTTRLARAAFEFAKANGNQRVTIVTKANIMKKTDGKFLSLCYEVAKDYPEIQVDDYYVDITAANLIKEPANSKFNVFILPNLYGDIITDEAAQIQGGVGTAGSINQGGRYAMFEAIHGSAPRMISEGRGQYANPSSIVRAGAMLLRHIGYGDQAAALDNALDEALDALSMTSNSTGNSTDDFTEFVISHLK
ncbi:isocitrate/isopropylmalate family dehydrogenase [Ihubacter massiliensis]|uniref:Isocitrate/isopropylmalate family dehydrogenase n=1 Tax=Hominibacterium faecale TaxID=2839743 RepID=A0A9J6QXV6_9FIRM|nr:MULTISPECIES: isocitrate/isopropylmalate family dehydrogenase [Eubacteriales Family XIII. Incertae Sedis]MCO7123658.1 isocitrate/isopropylmalate family dehydrogenase [Ihubacter massiliensis]MCU7380313.1 isocitrate/isopropylmalate family dehydrogenase [Hominibacterium faecale]